MLNEEKVKIMTHMAIYEKHKGKKTMKMTKYFRGDYVSWNLIKTILSVTIAYLLGLLCWGLYHLEYLLENIYTLDIVPLVKNILFYYAVSLGIYVVLGYIVYNIKYSKAMKSLKKYRQGLKTIKQINTDDMKGRDI